MKSFLLALIFVAALCFEFFSRNPAPEHQNSSMRSDFLHSTYLIGKNLWAPINQINYEQFDFIYVMAAPEWRATDFDNSFKQIIDTLVTRHTYPSDGRALLPELINMAHRGGTKIILSIAGTDEFYSMALDKNRRALFALTMAAFVEKYNYDGIDVDWEKSFDLELHILLMKELRAALEELSSAQDSRKYFLTTALHTWRKYTIEQSNKLTLSVDWINIMAYDMGGGIWGNIATHNTPLNEIKVRLNNWSNFPPEKLCIGLAAYGFFYDGISPGDEVQNGLSEYGRYFYYRELPPLLKNGWQESYDTLAGASYFFSPDRSKWVTIDNNRSHEQKLKWLFTTKYRGVFWWNFHADYFAAEPEQIYGTQPLKDHVFKIIANRFKK